MPPFVIFALPRSRTAWLSRFLTYGDWICGHEELRHARTMADVEAWLAQPCIGTAETCAAPWWRTLHRLQPDARVVVVRRPAAEVVESLMRLGLGFERKALAANMARYDRKLDQIEARLPNVLTVDYTELDTEAACAAVFEHCLPYQHDPAWWARVSPVNVQCNMRAMLRYWQAYAPQLEALGKVAKHQTLGVLARRPPVSVDGMTFQTEEFDAWLNAAQHLFAEHLVQVGEAPDAYLDKNIPLMRKLDEIGCMQVTTARSNGRMFGYLMSIISPSLESKSVLTACHTTFYASPDVPGLGLKLQRAALTALRARGVDEVLLRAGVRGSGPRMGALYKRLGAEDFGHLYKLEMA